MLVLEDQEYLTSKEVAKRLRLEHETILRWLRDGTLPGYRFGRRWRVHIDDYEKFVREKYNIGDQPKADPQTDKWPLIHFPYPEQELGR